MKPSTPSAKPPLELADFWAGIPLFWRFQLTGWAAFAILTFPVNLVLSGTVGAALCSLVVRNGFSFAITLGMRAIYGRVDLKHNEPGKIAATVGIVSVAAGLLQLPFHYLIGDLFPFEERTIFDKSIYLAIFYFRTGLFTCWSLLYFGVRQMRDASERELRLALIESEKRNAQLQMLRAQMNPHFLFNALNAIQAEIGKPDVPVKQTVKALAEYLRFSLDHGNDELIPLNLEYDAMLAYFSVEKLRFREDLIFESHIDDTAQQAAVPGIILQPLVENAIKYGQRTSDLPLQVQVSITRPRPDRLNISVSNTGQWVEPSQTVYEKESHIGLDNVRRRLGLLYPDKYCLTTESANGWVKVTIEIPIIN